MRLSHAKRRDDNERQIVEDLRRMGISVMYGDEVDLICAWRGKNYLFEVKNPDRLFLKDGVTFRKGAVKESQTKLRRTWQGQYDVVWDIEMILYAMGINDRDPLTKERRAAIEAAA